MPKLREKILLMLALGFATSVHAQTFKCPDDGDYIRGDLIEIIDDQVVALTEYVNSGPEKFKLVRGEPGMSVFKFEGQFVIIRYSLTDDGTAFDVTIYANRMKRKCDLK